MSNLLSAHSKCGAAHLPETKQSEKVIAPIDQTRLPRHIAIIMDGNGRWARQRHLPRIFGHRAGIASVRDIVRACGELGVGFLTLYAFSSENWTRPNTEISALMRLLEEYLEKELPELQKNNVCLRAIGRLEALPQGAQKRLGHVIQATSRNTGLVLMLALNYGGRQEIVDAANRAIRDQVKRLDEKILSHYLYAPDCPDPDLLIRTSGEMRISNFLLWQLAYAELYMTNTPWPEFRRHHLFQAITDYQQRERRFGGL
ncbi:MAG: isoprenyl transferase [Elusimicrobiota bacterium]|jgi:undecaprenyl diphosphate synthase